MHPRISTTFILTFIIVIFSFLLGPASYAQAPVNWNGSSSSNWNIGANWNGGSVPATNQNAGITNTGINPIVDNYAISPNPKNITITGGTLTLENTGNITTNGSNGDLETNGGTFNMTGGTLNVKKLQSNSGSISVSGGTLTLSNNIVSNGGSFAISAGTISCNNINTQSNPALTVSGGTITCSADIIGSGDFTMSGGTLNLEGDINGGGGTYNLSGSTMNFNGTATQDIGGTSNITFGNVNIANTSGVTASLSSSVAGDLTISSGTLNLGTNTMDHTTPSGGTLQIGNMGTLEIGGTNTFPANYAGISIIAGSTVEYSGSNQSVSNVNQYSNLAVSGSGTKTFAGNVTINAGLFISTGTVIDLNGTTSSANELYFDGVLQADGVWCATGNVDPQCTDFTNFLTGAGKVAVNTALPIELQYFNASRYLNKIHLTWSTASELNNERFIIERSKDGNQYSAIGEVQGSGTTYERQDYQFIDENPLPGINYYRLKQMDFDGSSEYSKVVSISTATSEQRINVFPNPAKESINVEIITGSNSSNEEISLISIYDMNGKMMLKKETTLSNQPIVTTNLPAGIYMLNVANSRNSFNQRILIQ